MTCDEKGIFSEAFYERRTELWEGDAPIYDNENSTDDNENTTQVYENTTQVYENPTQVYENCCPKCGSENVIKKGRTQAGSQVWQCKDCGKRFA